jgi:hypothetical protein
MRSARIAAVMAVELAMVWLANHFGGWYIVTLLAIVNGAVFATAWRAFATSLVAGIGGWGLALAWQALFFPTLRAASLVTGIMGFGKSGIISISLTLAIPLLLAASGVWLGRSVRGLRGIRRPKRA